MNTETKQPEELLEEQVLPEEKTVSPADEQPAEAATGKKQKKKKTLKQELIEWVCTIAAALLIAFVVRTFICEFVVVDGNSMNHTLLNSEVMLVTKPEYMLGDPERFDVVVCHYPNRGDTYFVKRVVGLPGDTVAIYDGYLYINGEKQPEEYLTIRPNYSMREYTVPEGQYFVLGDNRASSNDSHIIGPLDRDMILGKVHFVLFPFDSIRTIE